MQPRGARAATGCRGSSLQPLVGQSLGASEPVGSSKRGEIHENQVVFACFGSISSRFEWLWLHFGAVEVLYADRSLSYFDSTLSWRLPGAAELRGAHSLPGLGAT